MLAAFGLRIAVLLALCLPLPGTAHGHAVVVESQPADGEVVASQPEQITIVFNEPVSLISAQLLDARGARIASAGAQVSNATLTIPLPASLAEGTYIASYRTVSTDGHPVGGSLVFSIGRETAGVQRPAQTGDVSNWRAAWIVARTFFDLSLLGAAGAALFLVLVARGGETPTVARIASRFATAGCIAAIVSIGVQGGLLNDAHPREVLSSSLWQTGIASTFGRAAWIATIGLALIAAGEFSARVAAGRALALCGAAVALVSYAFAGHVVTSGPRWLTAPAFVAHVSAVAFWIGSLLPLRASITGAESAPMVRRFSIMAIGAVALLTAAGIVIAALQVRSIGALVTTSYGLILLLKLAPVAALLALAALNKLRLTPALERGEASAAGKLRASITGEIALALAIVAVTASLGTTPPPRALLAEHAHTPDLHPSGEHVQHGLVVELASGNRTATLTFASAHSGANSVEIALRDADGSELQAQEVTFTASNPAAGVEPIRREAVTSAPGSWKAEGLTLVPAGPWSIRVDALVSDFEKPIFEGSIDLQ